MRVQCGPLHLPGKKFPMEDRVEKDCISPNDCRLVDGKYCEVSNMLLNQEILSTIIKTNPGDFAVYQLMSGKLHTLYFSPNLPSFSGMTEEEYNALTAADAASIVLENDRAQVTALLDALLESGQDVDAAYRIIHKTMGFVWVHAKSRLIGTLDGIPVLETSFLNISSATGGHASLLNQSDSIVYVLDRHSYELLYANEPALQNWGRRNYCGRPCFEFVSGGKEPCPWCSVKKMKDGFFHTDEVFAPALGKWFCIDCHETAWFGHDAVVVHAHDITRQKQIQRNLEIGKDTLKKITDNIPVGLAVCKIKGDQISSITVNQKFQQLLGISSEEITEKDSQIYRQVHHEDQPGILKTIFGLRQPGTFANHAFRIMPAGESVYRWYRLRAKTLAVQDGTMIFSCLSDITAEKEAEIELRKSRQIYEAAVKTAQLSLWEYDIRGRRIILSDNSSTKDDCAKYAIPKIIENVPDSVAQWVAEKDLDKMLDVYRRIDAGAPSASCEYWYKSNPGQEPRCERMTYITVFDNDGNPLSAYGIGQDITTLKFEEENYARTYQQLAKVNPQTLGSFRLNLTKNWCGDGQSPYPFILDEQKDGTADGYFTAFASAIPNPVQRHEFLSRFNRASLLQAFHDGQRQLTVDYLIPFPDGSQHWLEGYLSMVRNQNSGDIEAVSYAIDVSDKKKAEEIMRHVTDKKCDFIGIVTPSTRSCEFYIDNWNRSGIPATRQKIAYDRCIAYALDHYVAENNRRNYAEKLAFENLTAIMASKEDFTFTFSCTADSGTWQRKQLRYGWLNAEKREIVFVQTDITDAYRQEQEQLRQMQEALHAAESANRSKMEFLSRISHDIRTPMNVISNMTNFAFDDIENHEKLKDDLKKIQASNGFLLSLINDVLDISKIDSGHVELHPEPCPYDDFIASIRSMFSQMCRQKGLDFIIGNSTHAGTAMIDRVRINQLVLNLLSNAIKYTPAGGTVTFTAWSTKRPDGNLDCGFSVKDTGIGMSAEFQRRMFEPFTQEFTNPNRPHSETGTGLGLAIVKRLVDLMGGTISVVSAIDRGTEISVFFVFPAVSSGNVSVPKQSSSSPMHQLKGKVLIVEDNAINTEIAVRMLKSFGLTVMTAGNGAQGVSQFQKSAPGEFKAILMDIQMPLMNGIEATQTLRTLPRSDAKTVPVIAMTADAFAEDVERCLKAGMNGHVSKPIDPKKLLDTLEQFI